MRPPEHLDPAAVAKWVELLPLLQTRGDIDQGTLDALAAYCSAWSRWVEAEAKVRELGTIVKSPSGFPIQNPYLAVAQAAQRALRQWAGELKLTPKTRGRATKTEIDQEPEPGSLLSLLRKHG